MCEETILGVDPGRSKCGLAVLCSDGAVLARETTAAGEVGERAAALVGRFQVTRIAIGRSTGYQSAVAQIARLSPDIPISATDERDSSRQARELYWHDNPPRGLWRLLPVAWRVPPEPVDGYAAEVLARRAAAAAAQAGGGDLRHAPGGAEER